MEDTNDIYVNYKGKSITIIRYIEIMKSKKKSTKQSIKFSIDIEKDYETNVKNMRKYNGNYIHVYDNLSNKLVKSIIPSKFSSQFTERDNKIMNYSKLELIFSLESGMILITKSRSAKQRVLDIEQDKNDIYVCLFFNSDVGGDEVLDMLKLVMKTFPNQKLQLQKTPNFAIQYAEVEMSYYEVNKLPNPYNEDDPYNYQ